MAMEAVIPADNSVVLNKMWRYQIRANSECCYCMYMYHSTNEWARSLLSMAARSLTDDDSVDSTIFVGDINNVTSWHAC